MVEPTYELYIEILEFLNKCGGAYKTIDKDTAGDLVDCLFRGQCYLKRNEAGEIVTFCDYWLVDPKDLEEIRAGRKPAVKSFGSVFFVVDCGNLDGAKGLSSMIRCLRKRVNTKGVAWNSREFGQFRYYPRQRGRYGQEQ